MIELHDVTQHYGVKPILRGISLRVERGEVVVILGPNGMGKTTLIGVMAGVLSPQRGDVRIDGMLRRGTVAEELAIRRMSVYLPIPMAITAVILVTLLAPAGLKERRLTGKHRIVEGKFVQGQNAQFIKVG